MNSKGWAGCQEPQSVETWRRRQKVILADLEAAELKLDVSEAAGKVLGGQLNDVEAHADQAEAELQRAKDALSRMNAAFSICDKARKKAEARLAKMREDALELARLVVASQGWDGNNPDDGRWRALYEGARTALAGEDMSGPDGPVADSSEGYKILQCEHEFEEEAK